MKQMNIHLVSTNSMITLMKKMKVHLESTNTMIILMENDKGNENKMIK